MDAGNELEGSAAADERQILAKGVSHLLSSQLTRILRTHAAMSVLGHGLLRGAGLGGPVGAALNGVKAVSGSAYRVTIPAVLRIVFACAGWLAPLRSDTGNRGKFSFSPQRS